MEARIDDSREVAFYLVASDFTLPAFRLRVSLEYSHNRFASEYFLH